MQKLVGVLIVAAASMTAATAHAAFSPGAAAVGSRAVLVRGGMAAGGFGGMNPGMASGMNSGGMGLSGAVGPSNASRRSDCAPSLWSRIFGSPDKDRCAVARTARSNTKL